MGLLAVPLVLAIALAGFGLGVKLGGKWHLESPYILGFSLAIGFIGMAGVIVFLIRQLL